MRRKVLSQILVDEARFREDDGLRSARCLNADDRRFSKRVNLFQFRRSEHLLPLEDFDVVVYA